MGGPMLLLEVFTDAGIGTMVVGRIDRWLTGKSFRSELC